MKTSKPANTLFAGLDQGSSSSKVVLLNNQAEEVFTHNVKVGTVIDQPPIVRQDPVELLGSIRTCLDFARQFAQQSGSEIQAVGLSCQRSGVCAWHSKTGKIEHELITWRDRSTKAFLDRLGEGRRQITEKSSLPAIPDYAGGKIAELQAKFPNSDQFVGTLDSYLRSQLVQDFQLQTDDSMAARTMLYNLQTNQWDSELCDLFKVDSHRLAQITPSLGEHGSIGKLPLLAMLGDAQAALIGRMNSDTQAVLNMGTISSIAVNTASDLKRLPGFVSSVLYSQQVSELVSERKFNYLIEGITNASGAVVSLITERLKLAESLKEIGQICESLNRESHFDRTIAYVPERGTATPDWRYDLPNLISGWDGHSRPVLVRALIESIACFIAKNIMLLKESGLIKAQSSKIMVSGGLSEIDHLVQFIADVSQCTLVRFKSLESSARGAALGALFASGACERLDGLNHERAERVFVPSNGCFTRRYQIWQELEIKAYQASYLSTEVLKIF